MQSAFSVDDFAAAFVRLEGGIILDFRISWAMHMDTPGDTIILGKKAGLRIPSTDCWNGSVGGPMTIYTDIGGEQIQYQVPVLRNDGPGLFDRKIRSFLDAILTGGPSPIPSEQIIYNQAIIDGICRSAELGRESRSLSPKYKKANKTTRRRGILCAGFVSVCTGNSELQFSSGFNLKRRKISVSTGFPILNVTLLAVSSLCFAEPFAVKYPIIFHTQRVN